MDMLHKFVDGYFCRRDAGTCTKAIHEHRFCMSRRCLARLPELAGNFWVFGFVWVGGFRMFGHPESLLWYDSFQATISVVEYFLVERKVDMRFDKPF